MLKRFVLMSIVALIVGACAGEPAQEPTATATPSPVATGAALQRATLPPTWTPAPTDVPPEPTATALVVDALTGIRNEPPISIEIPAGWAEGYDTLIYSDLGELAYVPFALYTGPITGGTGTIVLLWDYASAINPLDPEFAQPTPWLDGLRLLRTLIIEPTCNIGTGVQRQYRVGDYSAVGTSFSAVDCDVTNLILPEGVTPTPIPNALPDTRGWFAALNVDGVNFAFYVYGDPISAMDGASTELQAILDTVQFDLSALQSDETAP